MTKNTQQVLTLQNYSMTRRSYETQTRRIGDGIMQGKFSVTSLFFCSAYMCNTFTVHHKAKRHIVKTDVWLSIKRSLFLISDQFIKSKSREKIKLKSGLCQLFITANGKVSCWLIVSILWIRVELVLQVKSYPGVKRSLGTESSDQFILRSILNSKYNLLTLATFPLLVGAWQWGG